MPQSASLAALTGPAAGFLHASPATLRQSCARGAFCTHPRQSKPLRTQSPSATSAPIATPRRSAWMMSTHPTSLPRQPHEEAESSSGSGSNTDASGWLESARREFRAGNAKAARHMARCAVSAAAAAGGADSGRTWLAWARLEARQARAHGAYDDVANVLDEATTLLPGDPYLWHFWARRAQGATRTSGGGNAVARGILRKGAALCQQNAALRCEWARLEVKANNIDSARKLYREAVAADRTDSHTYMDWAMLELRCGRVRSARMIFADGVKAVVKGDAAVLYTAFARFEAKDGHSEQARFLFSRAAEANPKDKVIWQAWAAFEDSEGHGDRARELFERGVVVTGGQVASIWQAWGALEARYGNVSVARHLFARGTTANPQDPGVWAAWGRLEAAEGSPVEARRLFEHATAQVGTDAPAGALFMQWAALEAKCNNLDAACAVLATAVDRQNDSRQDAGRLLHAWGRYEWRAGRLEAARDLFERASRVNPSDTHVTHSLARIEAELGNPEGARSLLRRVHCASPSDGVIVSTLALLEWQEFGLEGGVGRARDLFETGARLSPNDAVLLKAWATFETAQGNVDLGNRLRSVARKNDKLPTMRLR
jgi:tetratricopeptide (TPR) repeat protein